MIYREPENPLEPGMDDFLQELDGVIKEGRTEMDQLEPGDHVWQELRQRLTAAGEGSAVSRKTITLPGRNMTSWWVAAAAAVVLSIAGISQLLEPTTSSSAVADSEIIYEIAPELKQAEVRFASTVSGLESAVLALIPENYEGSPPTAFLSDLEAAYEELKREASRTGMTEDVVRAMIKNYRLRIYLLEKLLEEFEGAYGNPKSSDSNVSNPQSPENRKISTDVQI